MKGRAAAIASKIRKTTSWPHLYPLGLAAAILALCLLVGLGGLQALAGTGMAAGGDGDDSFTDGMRREPGDFTSPLTLLLLGVDSGSGGTEPSNVDTVMLFYFDPGSGDSAALSIPRDTIVDMPGVGWGKMSNAYYYGGAALTRRTVEHFTGVPVHYYVELDFKSVRRIVDVMGGIRFDLDRRISVGKTVVEPGEQVLDGRQALAVLRFRAEAMADIARVERQQRFILSFLERLAQEESRKNLAALIPTLYRHVKTDIPMTEILDFYRLFSDIEGWDRLEMHRVPGSFYDWAGSSCWRADLTAADRLIREIFGTLSTGTGYSRYWVLERYEQDLREQQEQDRREQEQQDDEGEDGNVDEGAGEDKDQDEEQDGGPTE